MSDAAYFVIFNKNVCTCYKKVRKDLHFYPEYDIMCI